MQYGAMPLMLCLEDLEQLHASNAHLMLHPQTPSVQQYPFFFFLTGVQQCFEDSKFLKIEVGSESEVIFFFHQHAAPLCLCSLAHTHSHTHTPVNTRVAISHATVAAAAEVLWPTTTIYHYQPESDSLVLNLNYGLMSRRRRLRTLPPSFRSLCSQSAIHLTVTLTILIAHNCIETCCTTTAPR